MKKHLLGLFFLAFGNAFAQCPSPNVPIGLVSGKEYQLEVDAGYNTYQWYRNTGSGAVAIVAATSQTYNVTDIGRYSCVVTDAMGCPQIGCCEIEFVSCPSGFAAVLPVTCTGNSPNSDGKIHLNTLTNVTHYGYSLGNTYVGPSYASATVISGATDILTGISNPASPQPYTVRLFNGNGCFKDYNLTLQPKTCVCQPIACLDLTSTRIR